MILKKKIFGSEEKDFSSFQKLLRVYLFVGDTVCFTAVAHSFLGQDENLLASLRIYVHRCGGEGVPLPLCMSLRVYMCFCMQGKENWNNFRSICAILFFAL